MGANSSGSHVPVLGASLTLGGGAFADFETLNHWPEIGLLAVVVIDVSLEIKAEFSEGALSDRDGRNS